MVNSGFRWSIALPLLLALGFCDLPAEGSSSAIPTGRVLLVNDYLEVDAYGNPLPLQYIERFYQRWGVYHYDYDVWRMAEERSLPLSEYS